MLLYYFWKIHLYHHHNHGLCRLLAGLVARHWSSDHVPVAVTCIKSKVSSTTEMWVSRTVPSGSRPSIPPQHLDNDHETWHWRLGLQGLAYKVLQCYSVPRTYAFFSGLTRPSSIHRLKQHKGTEWKEVYAWCNGGREGFMPDFE
jgi:hypothetical protein